MNTKSNLMDTLSKNSGLTSTNHRIGGQKRFRDLGSFYQTVRHEVEGRYSPRDNQTMASSKRIDNNGSPFREKPSMLFTNSMAERPSLFNATSLVNM